MDNQQYGKPFTVLRRIDVLLEETKAKVLLKEILGWRYLQNLAFL